MPKQTRSIFANIPTQRGNRNCDVFFKKNGSAPFFSYYYLKYKLGLSGKFNKQQLVESYHYNTFGKLTIKNQNIPPNPTTTTPTPTPAEDLIMRVDFPPTTLRAL
ncbi:hypothetical protein [Bathymodiolus thermophilus thioautotrophic gill symbiont]|uniref:Uncharacterized protein n=1 Tax=Bathymodiolus thermophilus thioautotrophic gill symbiont TaxID=2360 RepID=A0A1J5U7C9_9GAMM|nr:hypothetical protein [Bathymodiolus thermophilus thioautotrophic gill symbiont]OIR24015.1 hypothetical protein BGC33_02295 [Bathymodiolus thermophilus thioautotrophic gill symbiont]OIR24289.1 hypothetical protein BGC33_03200 [Bathymodiolus thermophilus thioautotrophic gill symbiont]